MPQSLPNSFIVFTYINSNLSNVDASCWYTPCANPQAYLVPSSLNNNTCNNVCTNISFHIFNEYTQLIKTKQLTKAILIFYNLYDKGYSVMDILDNYFLFVKISDMLTEKQKYNIIPIICKYITVFHNIHEDEIELALFSNNMCANIDNK